MNEGKQPPVAGPALDVEKLATLAADGYRTVLDLRDDTEPHPKPPLLCPRAEAAEAHCLGLTYVQIPLALASLDYPCARRLAEALCGAESPVYVHCASGRRATAVVGTWYRKTARGRAPGSEPGPSGQQMPLAPDSPLANFCSGYLARALDDILARDHGRNEPGL